jgi:hypothetical protein
VDEKITIMKAYRKEEDFKPVTIIIESQDEFDYLWHCLNFTNRVIKKHSDTDYAFPDEIDAEQLWGVLHAIGRPSLA